MTHDDFCTFDPLLLLPAPPRSGLLLGPRLECDHLAEGYGHFERIPELGAPRPPADALVALEWQGSVAELVQGAAARLEVQGVLLARIPNRQLPSRLARRLYPRLEHAPGRGASLEQIRRASIQAGFAEHEVHCWLPSDSFPYVSFPVHERRMWRFYLEQLMPTWGLKSRIFSRCAGWLPPTLISPYFLLVARKGG